MNLKIMQLLTKMNSDIKNIKSMVRDLRKNKIIENSEDSDSDESLDINDNKKYFSSCFENKNNENITTIPIIISSEYKQNDSKPPPEFIKSLLQRGLF